MKLNFNNKRKPPHLPRSHFIQTTQKNQIISRTSHPQTPPSTRPTRPTVQEAPTKYWKCQKRRIPTLSVSCAECARFLRETVLSRQSFAHVHRWQVHRKSRQKCIVVAVLVAITLWDIAEDSRQWYIRCKYAICVVVRGCGLFDVVICLDRFF